MYFIELIIKQFKKKKEVPDFNPLQEFDDFNYENCEHNFMPVDSTGETLSCINCGLVVKKADLKKKNFFER